MLENIFNRLWVMWIVSLIVLTFSVIIFCSILLVLTGYSESVKIFIDSTIFITVSAIVGTICVKSLMDTYRKVIKKQQ